MSLFNRGRPLKSADKSTYEGLIGSRIRELRQRSYSRIVDFTAALNERGVDVTVNAVSMWELGERLPRITHLWAIADTLGVTINYLIPKENPDGKRRPKKG